MLSCSLTSRPSNRIMSLVPEIPMKGLKQHFEIKMRCEALRELSKAHTHYCSGFTTCLVCFVLMILSTGVHSSEPKHWAFQSIRNPVPPAVKAHEWAQNDLDLFVLDLLLRQGLTPSKKTSKNKLIRRAYLDLLGLPPTFEIVNEFENDQRSDAFERLIDRLLTNPSYGKHWGRHWLDVARYADAKGYVDAGEPTYPFAYTYRDYVVKAFNQDKPYSQFVMEQIAADRLPRSTNDPEALAGLGFLTVGSRFNFFPHEVIDDRIDVVTRGFLGLTVTCARCHDHKYDPVTSEDYYALYGIFKNSEEPTLDTVPISFETNAVPHALLEKAGQEAADKYRTLRKVQHERVMFEMRAWSKDYLQYIVQTTPRHRTQDQPGLVTERGMIREVSAYAGGAVKHWRRFVENQSKEDPVFGLWSRLFALEATSIPSAYPKERENFQNLPQANRLVLDAFGDAHVQSMADAAEIYGTLLESIDTKWREALEADATIQRLPSDEEEAIRQKLYGPEAPATIRIDQAIDYLTLDESVAIRKAYADIERAYLKEWHDAAPRPMMMRDRDTILAAHVFRRGDPDQRSGPAPRSIPTALGGRTQTAITQGSGRLELAEAITDPQNPLTARVIVNRIWNWHFGRPLVKTPSDFGLRSQVPAQAELLDYLASQFLESGGSIKHLHRLILGSATWQQSSKDRAECRAIDPDNNFLWRMNRRRLSFETVRDSMLLVSGKLLDRPGGPPLKQSPQNPDNTTRTLYNYIDREDLDDVFRIFDFPSPDISSPHRTETNVPQQALFLLNSPFVLKQATTIMKALPASSGKSSSAIDFKENLRYLYQTIYQRNPTEEEQYSLSQYLTQRTTSSGTPAETAWAEIAQTLLLSNEFQFLD